MELVRIAGLPDDPLAAAAAFHAEHAARLRAAATDLLIAFPVADHICDTLFVQDERVLAVTVKIVKLAISENGEQIGMTLTRVRR